MLFPGTKFDWIALPFGDLKGNCTSDNHQIVFVLRAIQTSNYKEAVSLITYIFFNSLNESQSVKDQSICVISLLREIIISVVVTPYNSEKIWNESKLLPVKAWNKPGWR